MTALLYYAGMAQDRQTEQIGLAISDTGSDFQRVNGDGLIVPADPHVVWKSMRTCNPTVLRFRNEWLMFYQGVGPERSGTQLTHVIAVARSKDAMTWTCDPTPVLTFEQARAVSPALADAPNGGVIEPAVMVAGDQLHMYFVAYRGHYSQGTWLYHARSGDGETWQIDPAWVLASHQFGNFRLHYPQVRQEDGRKLIWFTLIERDTRASAIVQMTSIGNDPWGELAQLLPTRGAGLRVEPEETVSVRLNGWRVRGTTRLNQGVSQWLRGGRNYFGYAHPHVLDDRLFYHAYHRNRRGQEWMDIGSCQYEDRSNGAHTVALRPCSSAKSWDAYFVADPFVVNL